MLKLSMAILALTAVFFSVPASAATCTFHHDRCVASTKTHVVGTLDPKLEPIDHAAGTTFNGVGSSEKCDEAFKMCMKTGEWVGPVTKHVHKHVTKE